MRRIGDNLLLLWIGFLPLLAIAEEVNPPSSAAIYQALEESWNGRQYAQLAAYLATLESAYGNYVPVQLARAIYCYKYGAQVEDAVGLLKELRARLHGDIAAASPLFMELLDSRILRYEKTHTFFVQAGISPAQRLADRDPLKENNFKHSEHWGDEMLFFNAPEVLLVESEVRSIGKGRVKAIDVSLEQAPVNTLQSGVADNRIPMAERKAFAQELVRRRRASGDVSSLVKSLRAADRPYTYSDTVEEMVKAGATAIPPLIEFINDPAHFPLDQKMAIWALVRIGVADPRVIQTLHAISGNAERADLAEYAQVALEYLQSRGR